MIYEQVNQNQVILNHSTKSPNHSGDYGQHTGSADEEEANFYKQMVVSPFYRDVHRQSDIFVEKELYRVILEDENVSVSLLQCSAQQPNPESFVQ